MVFTMDERKDFYVSIVRQFDKYWKMKLPCPVDPVEDIYRGAYSDVEWDALQTLMTSKPKALTTTEWFRLFWTDDRSNSYKCPYVMFKFDGTNYPDAGVHVDDVPPETREKVRHWIKTVNGYRLLREELSARCNGVMGNPTGEGKYHQNRTLKWLDPKINTPKQLFALWPEIFPLLPSKWKRDIQTGTGRQSKLPDEVAYRVVRQGKQRWATPEMFRCEDDDATEHQKKMFAALNHLFTMVSLAKDLPEVQGYPRFNGPISQH